MDQPPPPPRRVDRLPGELTRGWATALTAVWALITMSFAALWVSARNTGLSTWWLGPDTDPRPIVVSILPAAISAMVAAHTANSGRWAPWFGIVGSICLGGVAAGDLGRVDGYALVEFALASGGLLASLASFAGLLRAPRTPSETAGTTDSVTS
ncbi:MAG: hypothetical protein ACKOA2_10905 [Ilumatobacteraceae bacterium]